MVGAKDRAYSDTDSDTTDSDNSSSDDDSDEDSESDESEADEDDNSDSGLSDFENDEIQATQRGSVLNQVPAKGTSSKALIGAVSDRKLSTRSFVKHTLPSYRALNANLSPSAETVECWKPWPMHRIPKHTRW